MIIKLSLALISAPILSTEFFAVMFIVFPSILALFAPSTVLFVKLSVVIVMLLADKFPVFWISSALIVNPFPASIEAFLFFKLLKVFLVRYIFGTKTFCPWISSSTYQIISFFNLAIWSLFKAIPNDKFKFACSFVALS